MLQWRRTGKKRGKANNKTQKVDVQLTTTTDQQSHEERAKPPSPPPSPSPSCDWHTYAVRYKDLMDAFGPGGMPTQYENHYHRHGRNKGRNCQADPGVWDCSTYLNAARSEDLKMAFGTDCHAAVKHYIHHGRHEPWRKPGR